MLRMCGDLLRPKTAVGMDPMVEVQDMQRAHSPFRELVKQGDRIAASGHRNADRTVAVQQRAEFGTWGRFVNHRKTI
ncbi:hypothetical protein ABAC460_21395 [Asticcacaulis sp. AC460]|nr:hypothetical protein ABAC460_21395 [Asticcacaulis sp. AC460]